VRNAIAPSLVVVASAPTAAAAAQPADLARAAAEPLMKQLEAFRRDDYEAAYVFASTEIEQMLDRLAFERMVKGGYPEIARSSFALVARTDVAPDGRVYVLGPSRAPTARASTRSTRWCGNTTDGRSTAW
jgi:hypothetical protein